jgi:hypothetical protein
LTTDADAFVVNERVLHSEMSSKGLTALFAERASNAGKASPGYLGLPSMRERVELAAQEALANVRKHAGARNVEVLLEPCDGGLRVELHGGAGSAALWTRHHPPA